MEIGHTKRDFEEGYYNALDELPDVLEAVQGVETGREQYRNGYPDIAVPTLDNSVSILSSGDLHPSFYRERYAAHARYAQVLCAIGDYERAREEAIRAIDVTPLNYRFVDFKHPLIDQYRVIFEGRLALILAASGEDVDLYTARDLAANARRIARISQRIDKVAFADTKMSADERAETRSKYGWVAWAATAGIWLPLNNPRAVARVTELPLSRRSLAKYVCAR